MSTEIRIATGNWENDDPDNPLDRYKSASIKVPYRGAPSVSFDLVGGSPLIGLETDVWVLRNGVNWLRCRTLPVGWSWQPDGVLTQTVTAVGYAAIVGRRHIVDDPAPTFSGIDQGEIIWALIDDTQDTTNGDLGITKGTVTTNVPRNRNEYQTGDNLGTIFSALEGAINGPWWGIDADLELTVKQPSTFTTHSEPLVLGATARSLTRRPESGFANAAGAIGDAEQTSAVWVESTGLSTDDRGRWEVFDSSHGSTTTQATVTEHAQGALAEAETPPNKWTAEIAKDKYFDGVAQYEPGDWVEIGAPGTTDVYGQVTEVAVSVSPSGVDNVQIALTEGTPP